jgi:hypothetical protein
MSNGNSQDFEAGLKGLEELVAQQAERQQRVEESSEQTNARQQRLEEAFIQLVESHALLVQMVRNHEERLDDLNASHNRLIENDERLGARLVEIAEGQRESDERLGAGIEEMRAEAAERTKRLDARFEEVFGMHVQLMERASNTDYRLDRLELARAENDEHWGRFTEAQALLVQMIRNHDERLDMSVESDERLTAKFAEMLDTHRHTEERLDAFITVLERYISEDRNGKDGNTKQ